MTIRLAIVCSHPIQYYAPLFRELALRMEVHVFYMHQVTAQDHSAAGFGVGFQWDVDLLSGYESSFLKNISKRPGLHSFSGVNVPGIGAALKRGAFDLLLVTGWHRLGYLQAVVSAKKLGIPVIVRGDSQLQTARNLIKRTAKGLSYPALLRVFDAALYVGARSKEYWLHYHYPESRLFFSPHCVDNAWFANRSTKEAGKTLREKLGIATTAKVLLFAGKLMPFKRPLDLIDACLLLRRSGREVHALVAGAGELDGEMRQKASASGVPLHMLGFQNQSAMPNAYAAADALLLPSSSLETWGLVVNEALACGTPVAVSDACGCAPDLAGDGIVGASFPMGNISAMAERLAMLLDQPPTKRAIAEKITQFGLSAAADGIEMATLQIVKKRSTAL